MAEEQPVTAEPAKSSLKLGAGLVETMTDAIVKEILTCCSVSNEVFRESLKEPASQQRFDQLTGLLSKESNATLIVIPDVVKEMPSAAAAQETESGRRFVFAREAELVEGLQSDNKFAQYKAVMGHEMTHLHNHDSTPLATTFQQDPIRSQQKEIRADIGAMQPDELSAYYKNQDIPVYNSSYNTNISTNNPSAAEIRQVSNLGTDHEHASFEQTLAYLKEQSRLMQEYEKKHPPKDTEAYRKAEAEAVIGPTMEYAMREYGIGTPSGPHLPDAKNIEIENMAKSIGAELSAHVSVTPESASTIPVQGGAKTTSPGITK